ncbi:MAG: ATP-binding cassette domain-containing protein, partial [Clostridia bacterium]|nr:ATP-binding cassette domain-containing protein [Clostridia bacterium]
MDAVTIKNLTFSYENEPSPCIKGLDLTVREGEFLAVIGRNASGKSTLARLINGLISPLSGEIEVFGLKNTDKESLFEIRKTVGIVFQNPDNQMVASIVEDDVAFGTENIGLDRESMGDRIEFALKATGTDKFRESMASRLSGGQKQRVAIAGVLAVKPRILILDESTSMLDP